jgi:uncharacterized protein (DUF433 family)
VDNFGLLQRVDGVRSGRPCLAGSGLLVDALVGRFVAGDSIAELADEYREKPERIEAAIRLVLFARGTNIEERRAAQKVDSVLPLLTRAGRPKNLPCERSL